MARKASSQRRLQNLPPPMKLRSLSGVWHKGKREILNILCSKVRNIELCLNSLMQAILLGFFPCPENLNRYKKLCQVTVLHIKMAATHSSRAVELLRGPFELQLFEGLQFTARQAFRFTRTVCCKPFCCFPSKFWTGTRSRLGEWQRKTASFWWRTLSHFVSFCPL